MSHKEMSQLLINKTVFVDAQFGTSAGERENEQSPFLTLEEALAVALPGDTIFVHPGTYIEDGLVLLDGVNWYFEQGAVVVGLEDPIFLDDGNVVNSTISGYGVFIGGEGILLMTGASVVTMKGLSFVALGTEPMFSGETTSGQGTMTIEGTYFLGDGPSIVDISGNASIILNACIIQTIDAVIVNVDDTGSGRLNIATDRMLGGSLADGAINIDSGNFRMNLEAQYFAPATDTYAINVTNPTGSIGNTRLQITAMHIEAIGGILNIVTNPAVTDLFLYPRVDINAQRISATSATTSLFNIGASITNIYADSIFYTMEVAVPAIIIRESGFTGIDAQEIVGIPASSGTVFPVMLQAVGGTIDAPQLRMCCAQTFSPGPMLESVGNCLLSLDIHNAAVQPGLDQVAFSLEGSVVLKIAATSIFGPTPTAPGLAAINQISGDTILILGDLSIGLEGGVGINAAGNMTIQANTINMGGNSTTAIASTSNIAVSSINLFVTNGNGIIAEGFTELNINNIAIGNGSAGVGITLVGDGEVTGYVGRITTTLGPAIVSSGTPLIGGGSGDMNLLFDSILVQGNSGDPASRAILMTGTANIRLTGNNIDIGDAVIGIQATAGNVNVRALNLTGSNNEQVISINSPAGNMTFDISTIFTDQLTICGLGVSDGIVNFNTDFMVINSTVPAIFVSGTGDLNSRVGTITSVGYVLAVSSDGVIWLKGDRLETTGATSAVIISSTGSPSILLGGYISTAGPTVIEITSPTPTYIPRLSSSTLISTSQAISSVDPITVQIEPSIANNNVGTGITTIPQPSTLFVDPLVQ